MKQDPAYPGVWQALILLGLYYVAGTVPLLLQERLFGFPRPWIVLGTAGIAMPLSVAAVLWYGYRRTGEPVSTVFPVRPIPAAPMVGILALAVGIRLFGPGHEASSWTVALRSMHFMVVLVYGPVTEELLYRGLILRGFRLHYGDATALLGSSALFMVAHFQLGWQALSAGISGLLFGCLYLHTRTLLPCILVHSAWNATFFLTPENCPELWAWLGNPQRLPRTPHIQTIGFLLLVVGGVILMFYWLSRERVKQARAEMEESISKSAWALWSQARQSRGQDTDRLYEQAYAEFRRLEALNPRHQPGLHIWALTLIDDSGRKPEPEAERLLLEAQAKLSAALEGTPNAPNLIVAQAIALLWQANLKRKEVAAPFLKRGRALVEKVLEARPDDAYALSTWAHLLSAQVTAGAGSEIDRTLVEACDCIEAAAEVSGREQLLDGWGALLLARADLARGDEAVGYLRAAKEKFAEKVALDPNYATYNMASVCARLGQINECRQWLEGHMPSRRVRETMESDPDFENVREYDWFRKIVGADGDPGRPPSDPAE